VQFGNCYEAMKRAKDEAEVIVRLDYKEQLAHICVCQWPSMATRMRKRYGPSKDPGGKFSGRWTVPLRAISFRSPTRKPRGRPLRSTAGYFPLEARAVL
jgi:hypothetical protein